MHISGLHSGLHFFPWLRVEQTVSRTESYVAREVQLIRIDNKTNCCYIALYYPVLPNDWPGTAKALAMNANVAIDAGWMCGSIRNGI